MTIILITVSCVITGMLAFFTVRLQWALRHFAASDRCETEANLPTVSVCIPARNETHAMTQCLERVLASDYKKLEIIVFDDSSADDTSVLIRSFAHAGVRFVPGTDLPEGWLGKNHALNVLAQEASGDMLVFMDVDTHINVETISQLVGCVAGDTYDMVSVIPQRADTWRMNALFGTLRFFWQLVFSRRVRPASASSLWIIRRDTLLNELGGFAPFKSSVAPEAHIAAALWRTYRCVISNAALGVTYEKRWLSQMETARRLLYPAVGSNPWAAAVALAGLALLNVPFFALLSTFFFGWSEVQVMGLWLTLVFMAMYSKYLSHIWREKWWLGGFLWPVVVLQEFVLMLLSVWGYARHAITWKGRPVTGVAVRAGSTRTDI